MDEEEFSHPGSIELVRYLIDEDPVTDFVSVSDMPRDAAFVCKKNGVLVPCNHERDEVVPVARMIYFESRDDGNDDVTYFRMTEYDAQGNVLRTASGTVDPR